MSWPARANVPARGVANSTSARGPSRRSAVRIAPGGIGFAPEMTVRKMVMPHFVSIERGQHDRVSDIPRIGRPDCDCDMGGIFVRSKAVTEIRSLARSHTRTALNVLVG